MTNGERVAAIRTKLRQVEALLAEIYELANAMRGSIPVELAAKADAAWNRAGRAVAVLHKAIEKAGKGSSDGDVSTQSGGGK